MSYRNLPYVVFDDIRTMMLALYHCQAESEMQDRKADESLLPEFVKEIGAGQWAVPLHQLKDFDRMAAHHKWQSKKQSVKYVGKDVPLRNLLNGEWVYRDPFKPPLKKQQLEYGGLPIQGFDPQSPEMEYLLGVQDESVAVRLLNILTGYLVRGIRAIPLLADGGAPFKYFWLVAGQMPPLAALLTADRTWWGSVGQGQVSLFLQWPYDFLVSDKLLHKIPWGAPGGFVLLSQDTPHVLALRVASDGRAQRELIEVAQLKAGEARTATVAPDKSLKQFHVDLSLRRNPVRRDLSARIKELQREIRAKQAMLERLRDEELIESREPESLPQPLFIYYPEFDSPTSVPRQLQRLLVEWAGLETDLQSLRYLKLSTAGLLAEESRDSVPEVHVLTTSAALGEKDRSPRAEAVGLQLLDYPPMQGEQTRFQLLQDWAACNLRLFAPEEMALGLYPQFPANEYAAEKLGRALIGSPNLYRGDFVVLLLPAQESAITSLRIPVSEFKPLITGVEWECALDVAPASASVITPTVKRRGEQLVLDMEEAFKGATNNVAGKRLSEMENRLRQELLRKVNELERQRDDEEKRLEARTEMIEELRAQVNNIAPVFSLLDKGVEDLTRAQHLLGRRLEASVENSAKGVGVITTLESAIAKMTAARTEMERSNRELKQWQDKVLQLK